MLTTLAISGYRTLRNVLLPLQRLNVITGANGSGKTSLFEVLGGRQHAQKGEIYYDFITGATLPVDGGYSIC